MGDKEIQEIIDFLDSEKGREFAKEHFGKISQKKKMTESQIDRLNTKPIGDFIKLVEKSIHKYQSKEYLERSYKRGVEPQNSLHWFLYEYSVKWGRECSEIEWGDYGCQFTSDLRFCGGYYFELIVGQGSHILVHRENEKRSK